MSHSKPLPEIGQVVAGKYRIMRLLAQGGMGAVFAAYHELLQQDVALKLMLEEHASTPDRGAIPERSARGGADRG